MKDDCLKTCKNCATTVNGNYCSSCGQSSNTKRIDFHYLISELQHSIFHVDKGILFTIKELALRPGSTVKDYLSGKRVGYFKPFSFVLILGALFGFIIHFAHFIPEASIIATTEIEPETNRMGLEFSKKLTDLIYKNYSIFMLILLPFSALSISILFRKEKYNFGEYLVLCSFITGMQICISLVLYAPNYFLRAEWMYYTTAIISIIYSIWVLINVFDNKPRITTAIKAFLSIILSYVILMLASFIISFIVLLVIPSV